jgi:1-aminocyclopropane-1-carboxylate deaminase/D-cysteine desulfhydrase-like pyridoxal-dependent ACC family enzyme
MLEKFARYPLTFGPTPIEKLNRLGVHLGGKVELYAKREDCNSGLAFGGNKLRKLEYIVPTRLHQTPTRWCRLAACSLTIPAWSPRWRPRSA